MREVSSWSDFLIAAARRSFDILGMHYSVMIYSVPCCLVTYAKIICCGKKSSQKRDHCLKNQKGNIKFE